MLSAILTILHILGLLGIVYFICVGINISSSIFYNISEGLEKFSWKKLFKGFGKATAFFGAMTLLAVGFTMLPFINTMIIDAFGMVLIPEVALQILSNVGILGAIITALIAQGKKALEGTGKLGGIKSATASGSENEIITWTVIDPETETKIGE